MGRFITEMEPDPHKKYDRESRISRAVKKLVNMDQDKVRIFTLNKFLARNLKMLKIKNLHVVIPLGEGRIGLENCGNDNSRNHNFNPRNFESSILMKFKFD